MAILTLGKVILGGLTLDTDPQVYEPLNWEKRHSILPGLQGAVTIQDFGHFAKDNMLRLASGRSGYLNQSKVEAIHIAFRTKGATFTLTDWIDNEFTVFITSFRPVPTFLGESLTDNLFTYTMELRVAGITKLLGTPFVGA